MLARSKTGQVNQQVVEPVNLNGGTISSQVRGFTRINPPEFHSFKFEEDRQEFLDYIHKISKIIVVTSVESANLATFQLKEEAQIWGKQQKEERGQSQVQWSGMSLQFLFMIVFFHQS